MPILKRSSKPVKLNASIMFQKIIDWLRGKTVTINFDDVPDGTIIDSHYNADVTFSRVLTNFLGPVYARASADAASPPNVITVQPESPFFLSSDGAIKAVFTVPQKKVSIDVRNTNVYGGGIARMNIYDASGNLLSSVSGAEPFDPGFNQWKTISFKSQASNIAYIHLSVDTLREGGGMALFDNLFFFRPRRIWQF